MIDSVPCLCPLEWHDESQQENNVNYIFGSDTADFLATDIFIVVHIVDRGFSATLYQS